MPTLREQVAMVQKENPKLFAVLSQGTAGAVTGEGAGLSWRT